MMLRAILLLLALGSTAAACGLSAPPAEPAQIRVANHSSRDFDSVLIGFPSQQEEYGPIASGGVSAYRAVAQAYRYAYVEVQVDTARLVLQPIDYVGESLLGPGRFTYVLSLGPSGRELVLNLERD